MRRSLEALRSRPLILAVCLVAALLAGCTTRGALSPTANSGAPENTGPAAGGATTDPGTVASEATPAPVGLTILRRPDGPMDPLRPSLQLRFSAPMLNQVPLTGMTVWPREPISITWLTTQRLALQPARDLAPGERLEVALRDVPAQSGARYVGPYTLTLEAPPLVTLRWSPAGTLRPPALLGLRVNHDLPLQDLIDALRLDPPVAGVWRQGGDARLLVFEPDEDWPEDSSFSLTLRQPVSDRAGRRLALEPALRFRTRRAVQADISGGADRASVIDPLILRFDHAVDEASLRSEFSIAPVVPGSISWDGNTAQFTPERGAFAADTAYTLRLGTALQDRDGRPLLRTPFSYGFRTAVARELVTFGQGAAMQVLDASGPRTIDVTNGEMPRASRLIVAARAEAMAPADLVRLDPAATVAPRRDAEPTAAPAIRLPLGRPAASWDAPLAFPNDSWTPGRQPLRLPADLAPGAYRVVLEAGGSRSSIVALLTTQRLVAKLAAAQLLVWATDATGRPAADLPLTVYGAAGKVLAQGSTDALGLMEARLPDGEPPVWVLGGGEGRFAAIGLGEAWRSGTRSRPDGFGDRPETAAAPGYRGHLYTDRPIYRPGQTVHFKGILRKDEDGELILPASSLTVTVRLKDPRGNQLQVWTLRPSGFGTVAGELPIAAGAPLGEYRFSLELDGEIGAVNVLVEDYAAPELELQAAAGAYRLDAALPISGTVGYRFGQMAVGAEVSIRPLLWDAAAADDGSPSSPATGRWLDLNQAPLRARADAEGRFQALVDPARLATWVQASGETSGDSWGGDRRDSPRLGLEMTADDGGGPPVNRLVEVALPPGDRTSGFQGPAAPSGGDSLLRLTPDKARYQPGDTARLLVLTPLSGPALLTVERGQVRSRSIVDLKAPWTELPLPLAAQDAPNVFVSLQAWWPDAVAAEDAYRWSSMSRADGRLALATAELAVQVRGKELQVKVQPDRAGHAPGDAVELAIEVLDAAGQGRPAECSVAIVDEAVLALRDSPPSSLFDALHGRRAHTVLTRDAFAPRRLLADFGGGGGGGGGDGAAAGADPRQDFQDTALWRAAVVTDAQGRATVKLTLPDNLTRWRVVVVAVTAGDQLGQGQATVVAGRDLALQALWPRFLVQGDQVALGAMVQNRADVAQDVTVALRSQGLQLSDPLTQTLSVPPRGRAMVSWQAKAGDPGQARLTLRATSALAADALRREIPVRALAVPDQSITVGELARSAEQTVVLPVDAVAGQVTVRLERNLGGALLRGLEQLTGFPYGCVEQTMSKALPNAVVARAHSRLGLGQAGLPERLSAPITAGLQRLYGFQNEDGGWGWWADDGSDDSQTAWVVFGLGLTSEAGFAVDDAVVARGAERLTQRLAAMDARLRAFALYALALVKRGDEAAALKLAASPEPLDAFAQAALALALQRQGRNTEAEVLVDRLLAQIEAKDDQAWWPLAKGGGQPRMMPSAVRGTALGLSALLAIRPEDEAVPRVARWLISQRGAGGWGSTQESAFSIIALTDYLATRPEHAALARYELRLEDRVVGTGQLGPGALTAQVQLSLADLRRGINRLRLSQDGTEPIQFSIQRELSLARSPVSAAGPISVTRRWQLPGGSSGFAADRGDLVEVHLSLETQQPLAYVLIEDVLPAGLEAVNPRLATASRLAASTAAGAAAPGPTEGAVDHVELRADRVSLFITDLPKGRRELVYLARAARAGTFSALPATTSAMYDAASWGRSASAVFTVR